MGTCPGRNLPLLPRGRVGPLMIQPRPASPGTGWIRMSSPDHKSKHAGMIAAVGAIISCASAGWDVPRTYWMPHQQGAKCVPEL